MTGKKTEDKVIQLGPQRRSAKLYQAIGRFTVAYEHTTDAVCYCIKNLLSEQGLTNEDVATVFVGHMAAAPLRDTLQSLFAICRPDDKFGQRVLADLLKQLQRHSQVRNRVIHGAWTIRHDKSTASEGEIYAESATEKRTKAGVRSDYLRADEPFFASQTGIAEDIGYKLMLFGVILEVRTPIEVWFEFDSKGALRLSKKAKEQRTKNADEKVYEWSW